MLSGKGNRHQRQVQLEVQLHTIMIQVVTPSSCSLMRLVGCCMCSVSAVCPMLLFNKCHDGRFNTV